METNRIYCGDCGKVMSQFPEKSVDLIYADPPFFSNRRYEVIWGDGYEIRSFEDRWKGGIENYIAWMDPKLRECHRVLKDSGSMYLHCDWHANAHLRILMDKIFGENNFGDEIIWTFNKVAGTKKKLLKWHETIYRYAKNYDKVVFNIDAIREPYSASTLKRAKKGPDGKLYYGGRGLGLRQDIKRSRESPINPLGRVPGDVWNLGNYAPPKAEQLGYPTQKPETLLDRIISASSNPTDIVLDPFCGCGTAVAVAETSKRRWIGIDVSPTACKIMAQRMRKKGVSIEDKDIIGLPRSLSEVKAMQPFEFQNWVIQTLGGRLSERPVHDYGIDGWLLDRPVQVKQSDGVGRNVVDNFETALRRVKKREGVIVAFDFGRGAYEEVARAKLEDQLVIALMTVEDVLNAA